MLLFFLFFLIISRDLEYNNISFLPPRIFHSQNHLEQLFLQRNKIEFIPEGLFRGLKSLEWLLMPENALHTFPLAELDGLTQLKWLRLSHNQLTLENDSFPELKSITEM